MQADEGVVITADLSGLSAGRVGAPAPGSDGFVSGAGDRGGRLLLLVSRLETDAPLGSLRPSVGIKAAGGGFDEI